jgi:hypothetical protein
MTQFRTHLRRRRQSFESNLMPFDFCDVIPEGYWIKNALKVSCIPMPQFTMVKEIHFSSILTGSNGKNDDQIISMPWLHLLDRVCEVRDKIIFIYWRMCICSVHLANYCSRRTYRKKLLHRSINILIDKKILNWELSVIYDIISSTDNTGRFVMV